MRSIKAITFDLDNTLWHISQAIPEGERRTFAYLKRHCPDIAAHYDIPSLRQLMLDILKQQPSLTHQISRLRKLALGQAIQKSGYSNELAQLHAQAAFDLFMDARHEVVLFDHAIEMLDELHQHYQLGALTNGNADINRLPVKPFFDFCYSAEQVLSSKPNPELFQAALSHTSLTPSQCIHVGDHSEHDIFGGQQAGFYTIWVNTDRRPWPQEYLPADAEVHCLSEIPEAISDIETRIKHR